MEAGPSTILGHLSANHLGRTSRDLDQREGPGPATLSRGRRRLRLGCAVRPLNDLVTWFSSSCLEIHTAGVILLG